MMAIPKRFTLRILGFFLCPPFTLSRVAYPFHRRLPITFVIQKEGIMPLKQQRVDKKTLHKAKAPTLKRNEQD